MPPLQLVMECEQGKREGGGIKDIGAMEGSSQFQEGSRLLEI